MWPKCCELTIVLQKEVLHLTGRCLGDLSSAIFILTILTGQNSGCPLNRSGFARQIYRLYWFTASRLGWMAWHSIAYNSKTKVLLSYRVSHWFLHNQWSKTPKHWIYCVKPYYLLSNLPDVCSIETTSSTVKEYRLWLFSRWLIPLPH